MPFIEKQSINGQVTSVLQVRATLATIFALAIVGGFFFDKISQDSFLPIAVMCIGWFFGKQSGGNKPTNNENNPV
jgi:hypothetical protein